MKSIALALPLAAALTLGLGACSKTEDNAQSGAAASAASTPAQMYDKVVATGKGFTVGAMMSANTAYVLFDPQCPHCGHLWEAATPLLKKAKFVWIPVSIINGKSAPQGAALMSSATPVELMTSHEASILAGTGGIAAMGTVAPEVEAAIKQNTQLFNSLALESVPFIITKNARTGQVMSNNGAMSTAALSGLLGLE